MAKTTPPKINELELSLFGAGVGECLVVHLGAESWMIVDSCINESGDKAVALEYLEGLGVDVATQVKLVVVTHWHDDHIRGIAQVMRFAKSALFACSDALNCQEFLSLVSASEQNKLVEYRSGSSEFSDVLEVLDSRTRGRYRAGPDCWASDGMQLYTDADSCSATVWALSPSSQTITDSKPDFLRLLPISGQPMRRFPRLSPNDESVVLLVHTGTTNFLLGADMEIGRDTRRGWRAVLVPSQSRPNAVSRAYKVAHHGSPDADLDEIWEGLLTTNPYALLTPYAAGRMPRPSKDDVDRIKRRTESLYSTVWPPLKSPTGRDKAVERTIKEVTRSHRTTRKRPGHIRLRVPMSGRPGETSVELFDGATQL